MKRIVVNLDSKDLKVERMMSNGIVVALSIFGFALKIRSVRKSGRCSAIDLIRYLKLLLEAGIFPDAGLRILPGVKFMRFGLRKLKSLIEICVLSWVCCSISSVIGKVLNQSRSFEVSLLGKGFLVSLGRIDLNNAFFCSEDMRLNLIK